MRCHSGGSRAQKQQKGTVLEHKIVGFGYSTPVDLGDLQAGQFFVREKSGKSQGS
jgi:hypothetical protein